MPPTGTTGVSGEIGWDLVTVYAGSSAICLLVGANVPTLHPSGIKCAQEAKCSTKQCLMFTTLRYVLNTVCLLVMFTHEQTTEFDY